MAMCNCFSIEFLESRKEVDFWGYIRFYSPFRNTQDHPFKHLYCRLFFATTILYEIFLCHLRHICDLPTFECRFWRSYLFICKVRWVLWICSTAILMILFTIIIYAASVSVFSLQKSTTFRYLFLSTALMTKCKWRLALFDYFDCFLNWTHVMMWRCM